LSWGFVWGGIRNANGRNAERIFRQNADRAECRKAECRQLLPDFGRNAETAGTRNESMFEAKNQVTTDSDHLGERLLVGSFAPDLTESCTTLLIPLCRLGRGNRHAQTHIPRLPRLWRTKSGPTPNICTNRRLCILRPRDDVHR